MKDFSTYFGSYCSLLIEDQNKINKDKLNDVILPRADGFGDRHFVIKYLIEKNYYILKDLGEGSGTFIKIQKEAVLKNGHIVSFGDFHMVVGLVLDKNFKNESE